MINTVVYTPAHALSNETHGEMISKVVPRWRPSDGVLSSAQSMLSYVQRTADDDISNPENEKSTRVIHPSNNLNNWMH